MQIREAIPEDYQDIVDIHNRLHSDRPVKLAELVDADQKREPQYKHQRWLAIRGETTVGTGVYYQSPYEYHPRKFGFRINVLSEYQRQGIGSALYDWMIVALQPFDPIKLKASAYEDLPSGIRFLEKRGFVEVFRERKSELDVLAFDPAPYSQLLEKLCAEGIEFTTMKQTASDPNRNRALYDLERELMLDIPGVTEENFSWPDYDVWEKDAFDDPDPQPEAYFIARYQDEYIGMCMMKLDPDSNAAYQWLTGVKNTWRRRGIALVLKVTGILYAKANGYPVIRTSNAVNNTAILTLNTQVGFVPLSEWVNMEKSLLNR